MEALRNIERSILMFFQDIRNPVTDPIMQAITFLGDKGWFWILLSLILMIVPKTRKVGINCAAACAFDVLIVNVIVKNIVRRGRPYVLFEGLTYITSQPSDYSFPSGHTAISFAVAFTLLYLTPKKYSIPTMILASLIALSRLYVGVHYPTDIIGGIIAGAVASALAIFTVKKVTAYISTKFKADNKND